jgi:Stress responsive A/B Barrel Domain.
MIKHIVFWRLNDAARAPAIKAALEGLNGRIPGLIRLEVGVDSSGDPDCAQVALYSEFESREALAAYHHHPEHVAVAPLVKAARTERRVVDYEVE